MKTKEFARFLLSTSLLVISIGLTGCKMLLPAHPNSNTRKGERVRIEMITHETVNFGTNDFATNFLANYKAAFEGAVPGGTIDKVAIIPALASAAVGFAVDYVGKELEKEAKLYQAQFSKEELFRDFWSKAGTNGGEVAKYCGLRLIREQVRTDSTNVLFEFICGFEHVPDAGLWVAKPLEFRTSAAKAKVISGKWYHQLLVFPWLLRYPGSEINSEVEIEMTGHFRDIDQTKKDVQMGVIRFKMPAYGLNEPATLSVARGNLSPIQSGPFNSAPISLPLDGKPKAANNVGLFTVTARVTESDVSNVSESIEKAGKYVTSKKEDWQKKAAEIVTPKPSP